MRNTVEEIIKFVIYLKTERVGFEPTDAFTSLVFKTRAFNHSTTFPKFSEFQNPTYGLFAVFLLLDMQDLLMKEHSFVLSV